MTSDATSEAAPDTRPEPPLLAGETETLTGWLDRHRATLAHKCAGLTPAQLAERSVAPSGLSLLGLVRHASEVERNWFRRVVGGADTTPIYYSDAHPDGEFDLVDPATVDAAVVEEAFATWHAECDHARRVVAALPSLDLAHPLRSRYDPRDAVSGRWVLVHVIEEYARHNGHADLLRERVDGVTGE